MLPWRVPSIFLVLFWYFSGALNHNKLQVVWTARHGCRTGRVPIPDLPPLTGVTLTNNNVGYGLGALMLGIVGLTYGDFALQWQPVPAAVPLHVPLAYISAALLIAGGVAVLVARIAPIAALCLGSFYALWVVFLHAPRVFGHPSDVSTWLGFAEIGALAVGGVVAWTLSDAGSSCRTLIVRVAQVTFGACLLVFGLSHFIYADFTAAMIPGWMPLPLFWAYATGGGHVAAGLSFISGIAARLASTLLAAMLACFVALLHLPRVFADPTSRIEWTMLGVATSLTGAAWIVRTAITQAVPTNPARSVAFHGPGQSIQ